MIIIVSEYQDAITDKVIEYLIFDNLFFIRINESETISDFNLYLCNNKLHIDFSTIRGKVKLSEIQFIWYRRGNISLNMSGYFIDDKIKNKSLMSVLNKDWEIFKDFFYTILPKKKSLGSYSKEINDNKLNDLFVASNIGLKIPKTYIVSQKGNLKATLNINKKIITKNTNNYNFVFLEDKKFYFSNTTFVNEQQQAMLGDFFSQA